MSRRKSAKVMLYCNDCGRLIEHCICPWCRQDAAKRLRGTR